jgi:hypothetical protein
MVKNRYYKDTLGIFAEVIIAQAALTAASVAAFVALVAPGQIWAFWTDTNLPLAAGDTALPANKNRSFYYVWKDSENITHTSAPIPVTGLKYDSKPYSAGQVQISEVTFGGVVSPTQILHLRIQDTRATQIPYPFYTYDQPFITDIATTVAALAAQINAEPAPKAVSAVAAAGKLTVTGLSAKFTFKMSAYIEVSPTANIDQSLISFNYTTAPAQVAKLPIGDRETVKELEVYETINAGGINYAPEGTSVDEWQEHNSNSGSTTQWGLLMVYSSRIEAPSTGVHPAHNKAYVIIATPTGQEALLAAL